MDALSIHAEHMATDMGLNSCDIILIYQDNASTIWLTANKSDFIKNRGVNMQVNRGKVEVGCQLTDKMVADIETK